MAQNTRIGAGSRRGYTLIEMMIVMVILIVVMALVAPVIGNARNAAKRTNTQQLLTNLAQASQQFIMSERRDPGFFPEADMGSVQNQQRGFTAMENIMLDLTSGRVDAPGASGPADGIQVGPLPGQLTWVRPSLIGAPTETKGVVNKGYFTPDPKYYQLQDSLEKKVTSVGAHYQLPDLIDGFGQPLLAWRMDIEPAASLPFASMNSAVRASFYRAPNLAFLGATKLGKKEQDQTNNTPGENGSLLSARYQDSEVALSMHGLLGNPAFPLPSANPNATAAPAAARGRLVFHSAGTDGTYLGLKDRGGIIASDPRPSPTHVPNVIDYRPQRDAMDNFDDVITVAGN